MAAKKNTSTKKRTTYKSQGKSTRSTKSTAKSRQKKPPMDAQWSIFLFGIGILLLALTFVKGDSAWSWVRQNVLFGIFGISAYLLSPFILYAAMLVAMGQSVKPKILRACLILALVSGASLIFSQIDITPYDFSQSIAYLHEISANDWGLGSGVLGMIFGWTLLVLCGRPGANILLVVLMAISGMIITGMTLADIYYFFTGKAGRVKESLAHYNEGYNERVSKRMAEKEARIARLEEKRKQEEEMRLQKQADMENAQAIALANTRAPFDQDAFAAARTKRDTEKTQTNPQAPRTIDVSLGPDSVTTKVLHDDGKVEIGPGGTFGLDGINGQFKSPFIEPDKDFGAIITRKATGVFPANEQTPEQSTEYPQAQSSFVGQPVAQPQQTYAQSFGQNSTTQNIVSDLDLMAQKAANVAPVELQAAALAAYNEDMQKRDENGYAFPPLSLFNKQPPDNDKDVQSELKHNAELLVKTLESFGVKTKILDISRGPSVTRYELQPLAGVKISRITGLSDDIALNLATMGVRIEAPIPGKAAVGIEIPNKVRSMVSFRSILESPEFSTQTAALAFAVGKDIAGQAQVGNLAKMPHLLIAGTTGSGKSVCTNSIIMSFLYRCPPQKLRLLLIDPKMVEFAQYNGIPHLLMPVVTEPRKAAGALGSAVAEMEKRYQLLAENGVPNIEEYNTLAKEDETLEPLPYFVIVIDELADLMMVAGKEVEDYICRIAQKARAAGMHLIIATQRPSVDVITGLIKANIPSRIGLSVMSQIDSRTILDTGGAEKLLGNGDMLYMPVGVNKPVRIQGAFIKSAEIRAVIDFLKKNSSSDYDEKMIADMEKRAVAEKGNASDDDGSSDNDPMFKTAVEVVLDAGQASTSLLQRRCKLGYSRAARIMDEMEQAKIIGPSEGSKPRQVLISRQQWIEMTMQQPDVIDN